MLSVSTGEKTAEFQHRELTLPNAATPFTLVLAREWKKLREAFVRGVAYS